MTDGATVQEAAVSGRYHHLVVHAWGGICKEKKQAGQLCKSWSWGGSGRTSSGDPTPWAAGSDQEESSGTRPFAFEVSEKGDRVRRPLAYLLTASLPACSALGGAILEVSPLA